MSFSFLATVFLLAQAGAAAPAASPAAPGAPGAPQQSLVGTLVPFVFMAVIFYFVLVRPQQKRQREMQALLAAIKNNDKVVTNAGIHGVVTQVKERTVILRVDEGVKIEFEKSAIASVVKKADAPAEPAAKA
ncbi:MAG: preprotein translocase subunit YajC [Verrucomicrobia bacterium]|nr:preprotein translocase subunit YajC [Verrucomicrobiota bacterium]